MSEFDKVNPLDNDPELRTENLAARQHYTDEGIKHLMSSVCLQAVQDYLRPESNRIFKLKEESKPVYFYMRPYDDRHGHKVRIGQEVEVKDIRDGWGLAYSPKTTVRIGWIELKYFQSQAQEIEEFFDSQMFCYITGMSGKEEAIRRIRSVPRAYQSTLIKSLAKVE